MNVRKAKHGWIFTLVFTLISIAYVFPIALVVINSFKKKAYISKKPFAIPTDKMFVGIENYILPGRLLRGSLLYLSLYYGAVCWRDHPVYLHVCVVYQPCKESFYNCAVFSVSVFDDRSVPDGNVYPVQAGGYAEIK